MTVSGHSSSRAAGAAWLGILAVSACWLIPLSRAWRSAPDLGHSWAAPVLMAYLWWERWSERPSPVPRARVAPPFWFVALALAALLFPVRLLLVPFPLWPLLLVVFSGLFVIAASTAAWLYGGRAGVKWVAPPFLLLFATLPLPSFVDTHVIEPLRRLIAALAADVGNLCDIPAIAAGTSIRLAQAWVGVDEACGGIRSLQGCLMMALFFGEWYRFSGSRRAALVLAAVACAVAGNFLRVVYLLFTTAHGGIAALESGHDAAGGVAMILSLTSVALVALTMGRWTWPAARVSAPSAEPIPPAALRWVLAFSAMAVGGELSARAWFLRGEAASSPQRGWTVQLPVADASFHRHQLSRTASEMLRPDVYDAGRWRNPADDDVWAYYVEWRTGQIARSVPFLHNPTVCLPMAGCELISREAPLVIESDGDALPFATFRFRQMGRDLFVAFTLWDPSQRRPLVQRSTHGSWVNWLQTQWTDVAAAREHQPAQLLAASLPWHARSREDMQSLLKKIIVPLPRNSLQTP